MEAGEKPSQFFSSTFGDRYKSIVLQIHLSVSYLLTSHF